DDFAAPATRHCNQPEDLGMDPVAITSLPLPENAAQNPVLGFAEPTVADLVFRFAKTMRWVVFDHPGLDRIGEDAAKQAHGPDRGTATAANDSFAPELLGLHGYPRLAGDDVLHQIVHV